MVNGAVGLMAGSIGKGLTRSPRLSAWLNRTCATIFTGLALRLALIQAR